MRYTRRLTALNRVLLMAFLSGMLWSPGSFGNNKIDANIAALLSTKSSFSGPNCWNATFYTQEIYPYKIIMSKIQTQKIFESPTCKLVEPSKRQKGDILRYVDRDYGVDIHTATYLGDQRYFQKLSNSNNSPYEIVNLDEIEKVYGQSDSCQNTSECSNQKLYYRCTPNNFILFLPQNIFEKHLDTLAKKLSELTFNGEASLDKFEGLKNEADSFKNLILADQESFIQWLNKANHNWENLFFDINQQSLFLQQGFSNEKLNKAYFKVAVAISTLSWVYVDIRLGSEKKIDPNQYVALFNILYGSSKAYGNPRGIFKKLQKNNFDIDFQILGLISNPHINYGSIDSYIEQFLNMNDEYIKNNINVLFNVLSFSVSDIENYEDSFYRAVQYLPQNSKFAAIDVLDILINKKDVRLSTSRRKKLVHLVVNRLDPSFDYGIFYKEKHQDSFRELGIKFNDSP